MAKAIHIKQTKSTTQSSLRQKATMKALGLRGLNSEIYRKATRAVRGMLNQVQHLIHAEQVEESKTPRPVQKKNANKGYMLS